MLKEDFVTEVDQPGVDQEVVTSPNIALSMAPRPARVQLSDTDLAG